MHLTSLRPTRLGGNASVERDEKRKRRNVEGTEDSV